MASDEPLAAEFACPVCYEGYHLTDPKVLPSCGHSVCAQCVQWLIQGNELGCPVCRKVNIVTDHGLTTNFALKGACEAFVQIMAEREDAPKIWSKWLGRGIGNVVQKGLSTIKNEKSSPESPASSNSSGSENGCPNFKRILIIGGYNNQDSVEVYHPRNASKNHILDCQPSIRRYRHVAVLFEDKPWIAGGTQRLQGVSDQPATLRPLDSCEFFDFQAQKWIGAPNLSTTRECASAAVCLDRFFIFGGLGGAQTGEMLNKGLLWGYNWTKIRDLKSPTWSAAAVPFDSKVYMFGGESTVVSALTPVQIYNPERDQWTFGREMQLGRKELAAVAMDDNSIVICGGWDADRKVLKSSERLDPRNNVWTPIAPMNEVRAGHVLVNCDGRLLAMGGRCSKSKGTAFTNKSVDEYDPRINKWRLVNPMVSENWAFAAVVN